MIAINIYYNLKPYIPRRFQIALRRHSSTWKLWRHRDRWPIDENTAQSPTGWPGWPNQYQFAVVLTHDVETYKGHEQCRDLMQLEEDLGFRSSFNFVPERYSVSPALLREITDRGFEVGVHGLNHDGKLFSSETIFRQRAPRINHYIKEWKAVGFRSPAMLHNLDWIHALDIEYDASTFDTDPFEPQPEGLNTIFPVFIEGGQNGKGYVELPYTMPQDFSLFVIMRKTNIDIWKMKLDWIAEHGGMVLIDTHPDYMRFDGTKTDLEEYPAAYYRAFLEYLKHRYQGQYWHTLPKELSRFFLDTRDKLQQHSST